MSQMGKIKFNTTTLLKQEMKFGLNLLPKMTGRNIPPETDEKYVAAIGSIAADYYTDRGGSLSTWQNYRKNGKLFNIEQNDALLRGKDFNTLCNGLGAAQANAQYDAFVSTVALCKLNGTAYSPCLPMQRPPIDGWKLTPKGLDYADLFSQIDYIIAYCQSQGVEIYNWRGAYEIQVQGNADIYPQLSDLVNVTTYVFNYLHTKNPDYKMTVCAMIATDTTDRFGTRPNGQNAAMSKVPYATTGSNYLQVQQNTDTIPLIRICLAGIPNSVDLFLGDFGAAGIQMEVSQEQFGVDNAAKGGTTNPYTDKVGQGATMCEHLMRCLLENVRHNKTVIGDYTLSQSNGLVSGSGNQMTIKPEMYMMNILDDILHDTIGIGAVQFQNLSGIDKLIGIGAVRENRTELYVMNWNTFDVETNVNLITPQFLGGHHFDAYVENAAGNADMSSEIIQSYDSQIDNTVILKAGMISKVVVPN